MVEKLDTFSFKEKIHDFDADGKFTYKGDKPAIIDFYADWCGPCKAIAPVMEELSEEYEGKMNVYKINLDENSHLAQVLNIQSIPSILFIPDTGEAPQMAVGSVPKDDIKEAIKDIIGL